MSTYQILTLYDYNMLLSIIIFLFANIATIIFEPFKNYIQKIETSCSCLLLKQIKKKKHSSSSTV